MHPRLRRLRRRRQHRRRKGIRSRRVDRLLGRGHGGGRRGGGGGGRRGRGVARRGLVAAASSSKNAKRDDHASGRDGLGRVASKSTCRTSRLSNLTHQNTSTSCVALSAIGTDTKQCHFMVPSPRTTLKGTKVINPTELGPHSHSMVPGGLLVMSSTTRLTSGTSLVMRVEIRSSTS